MRNVWRMHKLFSKLVCFINVSYFHWLGQTHELTAKYIHYKSVIFIVLAPNLDCVVLHKCLLFVCFVQILFMGATTLSIVTLTKKTLSIISISLITIIIMTFSIIWLQFYIDYWYILLSNILYSEPLKKCLRFIL